MRGPDSFSRSPPITVTGSDARFAAAAPKRVNAPPPEYNAKVTRRPALGCSSALPHVYDLGSG